ncbi:NAD(P)-binding domain-containing protein [Belnapia sp. T18]|uniref:NAD(P)-binding domain-containing protein n=1 Tax=Belnapia arida TaxID=2804533 RepID=A0ABS1UBT6_9PROT|nr:NAD(P)-binding domain-containing protein [Belnapia arida]MBL6082158.1 NAD(P)-binding domain-containing protein [Belnapia arida]
MKIGIVGSGKISGLIGTLWSQAGHEVLFSSRHPQNLAGLVARAGGGARAGKPDKAIAFGDAVLLSIPFFSLPDFDRNKAATLHKKIVLGTPNPFPNRDGEMAEAVRRSGRGTGPCLREWFPGVRIVRAFNSVLNQTLTSKAHRASARVKIPLASDHEEALQVASKLVTDAGFDPVIVGPLDRSREFDFRGARLRHGHVGSRSTRDAWPSSGMAIPPDRHDLRRLG